FLPSPPLTASTLFPYTTLFRSVIEVKGVADAVDGLGIHSGGEAHAVHRHAADGAGLQGQGHLVGDPLLIGHIGHAGRNSDAQVEDRKSTRLNSSHVSISYAVFC